MPNAYLKKQREIEQASLSIGMQVGFQECFDLMCLCLHDPAVMGKDTFGADRIRKLFEALHQYERELGDAWSMEVESDVQQEHLDAMLREIFGEGLAPFATRYPEVAKPNYKRPKKNWR